MIVRGAVWNGWWQLSKFNLRHSMNIREYKKILLVLEYPQG